MTTKNDGFYCLCLSLLQLSMNCYDYTKHVQLIEKLESSGELELIRAARERMSKVYPLTPKLWLNWINDEIKIATTDDEKKAVLQLFDRAVNDYVSVDVWLEYVQFSIGMMQALTVDGVRAIFERSLTNVGLNVDKGVLIWDTFREFETIILQSMGDNNEKEVSDEFLTQIEKIFELYRRQLSIPLIGMETTLKECEDWCRTVQTDFSIDLNLTTVRQNYNKAFRELEKLIPFEDSLKSSEAPHLEEYLRYIDYETCNGTPNRVQSIYERALTENCLVADLWIKYTNYLDKKIVIETILVPVYERAVRNCTWSSLIWINFLKALERLKSKHEKVIEIFEQALQAGFQDPNEYLQLWITYLDCLRRKTDYNSEKELKSLRTNFEKAIEHLANIENADPNCSIIQYLAKIEAKFCKNMDKARQIWNELLSSRKDIASQAQNWICFSRIERVYGDDKHYRKVLMRGLTTCNDWPESIGQILLEYEREEGSSIESFDEAFDKYESVLRKINRRRAEKAEKEAEIKKQMRQQKKVDKYELKRAAKRKAEKDTVPTEVHTDTDGFKIPQSSVSTPKKSKQEARPPAKNKPAANRSDAGDAGDKADKKETGESSQDDGQPKHGISYRGDGTKDLQTVFVSNLDFKINENQLREAFEKFGKVDDVRLVRNYKGLSKGYAYIEYSSIQEMREALKHDRMPLEGRPVFISEIGKKKSFTFSTSIEKHKIFVKNLAPEVTNEELKKIYDKYGSVKDARVVTYRNGHSKGCAYVEFEDESSALEAVKQTDNLLVAGRNINVAISNPNARLSRSEEPANKITEHHVTRPSKSKINAPMIPMALRVQRSTQNGVQSDSKTNGAAGSSTALSNKDFRDLLLKK